MNKKTLTFIIIFGVLFLGVGAFLFVNQSNTHEAKNNPSSQHDSPEKGNTTEENKQKNNQKDVEASKEPTTEKFKGMIVEAVKGTVDLFSKETHVVAVGDSLTQGVGDSTGKGGYVGILDKTINQTNQLVKFENFGHHGDRTDQLLVRLDDPKVSTAIADADVVLMTIGANDIMQVLKENFTNLTIQEFQEERVHYEARLRRIFSEIQNVNPDAAIYLIGFYNPYDKYFKDLKELAMIVNDWNSAGRAITEELDNVTYIPTKDLFDDTDEEIFAEDNFHPNDLGYKLMAERVLEYLTKQER